MVADLHYTIPRFFEDRVSEHSMVRSIERIEVEGEFLYEIKRRRFGDTVRVWLSDAYLFGDMDYMNRPRELRGGDYILIAKPEGSSGVSDSLVASDRIGVGKLNEFMGALNVDEMWTYKPPTEEERRARREKSADRQKKRGGFRFW